MAGLSIKGAVSVVDHYERLKISRDAPLEVIRAAYRALAAKHHPDRHGQSEGANTDMALLNAAYEVLCDPEARAAYDASLLTAAGPASMFGAEPPDIDIQPARRSRPRARPAPAGEPEPEFQPDIDWSSLVSKPKANPWLTSSRLVPIGGVLAAMVLGGTYWWSQMMADQMASERLLASSYNAQAKAKAAALAASGGISGGPADRAPGGIAPEAPGAATQPAQAVPPLPPLRPLRHPLDGEPLPLKREAELVDPLSTP